MNERLSFIRAICNRPADDLPRLVFADWLEEKAAGVCEACCGRKRTFAKTLPEAVDMARRGSSHTCPTCHGTGTNGYAERAEFIRLSIEYNDDASRCPRLKELWDSMDHTADVYRIDDGGPGNVLKYTRGFVSEFHLTLAQFEQHAGAIAAKHPISETGWVLTDCEPLERINRPPLALEYFWPGTGYRSGTIFNELWLTDYLSEPILMPYQARTGKVFHIREDAIEARARACYVVARRRAEELENPEKEEKSVYIPPEYPQADFTPIGVPR